MPPSRDKARLFWVISVAGCLGVVVFALLLCDRALSGLRLQDGSRLRILGIGRGPGGAVEFPRSYARPPFTWIPPTLRQRFGLFPMNLALTIRDTAPDAVFVWFTRDGLKAGKGHPRLFFYVEVVDASGQVIGEAAQTPFEMAEIKGGVLWVRHPPADGSAFQLRLHGGNPLRVLGELTVPAAPTSAPPRTASPRR